MNKLTDILEVKGQDFVLKKGILKTYVLQKYVDTNVSTIEGPVVNSLGLLPYRWYNSFKDAEADKPAITGTLKIPTHIRFYPQEVESDKDVQIYKESYTKPYTVLTFVDGYKTCQSEIIKDLDNVNAYVNLYLNGRMDNNIPYNILTEAWIMNMIMNDISLNVPVTTLSTITKELCRDPKNMSTRWADVIAKQKTPSMIGYVFGNIQELSASSVFGGISFENFNQMVDIGLSMTKEDKQQIISPIEDILKL